MRKFFAAHSSHSKEIYSRQGAKNAM